MARFGLLVFLAAAAAGAAAATVDQQVFPGNTDNKWDWNDCGTDSHLVHIQSISISPDPPQRGKDLTITVEGIADEDITEGAYAEVTVKAGVIKLLQKEFDICEEAEKANTTVQCPVEKGTHKVVQTVTLPKEIPPAKFNVAIRGFTEDDEDLACMDLMMDFRLRFMP
ncbi:ML domain-containing protein [Epithele typhae]|uniref:ML domain-containing protein n=1 Tax=Epithele typhae TaxID=378194 RepID=UPI002008A00F|nr:ML domain-containing protein [Epithele typhae]KAH9944064.1 ML domain-containing protein [Epithele typhae]